MIIPEISKEFKTFSFSYRGPLNWNFLDYNAKLELRNSKRMFQLIPATSNSTQLTSHTWFLNRFPHSYSQLWDTGECALFQCGHPGALGSVGGTWTRSKLQQTLLSHHSFTPLHLLCIGGNITIFIFFLGYRSLYEVRSSSDELQCIFMSDYLTHRFSAVS